MRMLLIASLLLAFALPTLADDLKGKSVTVKVDGLQLGRKHDGGLIRDGDALSAKKSYVVKADDGTFLELAGGFVFKSDVEVVAMAEFPKKFVKDADGEKPKDRWAFGTKVLPTKSTDKIQFGDWIDDKREYFKMSGIMPMDVRKDNGDGWVRIHDRHREGWVQKEYLVTKEDAPIFWDKAVKANPKDTWPLFMRGVGWLEISELDNALADFNECIRLEPGEAAFYNSRGNAWSDKKEYDKAIADYTEAIRLKLDGSLYYNNRGAAWRDKKEYDKGIADFTESTRLNPKDVTAYHNRGLAWVDKKEYDKAISDYTEAIRLDPNYVSAYSGRGLLWSKKKEYDKAIADYTEVIRLDAKNVYAYINRGIAWCNKKEYNKAIADYNEAIRLDPKMPSALDRRGYAWHRIKKYDKAIADFDESLKLDAKSVEAFGVKAMSLVGLKKYDEAVDHFEKALLLEQECWVYKRYAFFRATCPDAKYRDGKKAVELAKLAIEKAGKEAGWEYSATLAAAYAEAGDFELAVSEQRKVLDDKHLDATDTKEQETRLALYRAKKPYRDE